MVLLALLAEASPPPKKTIDFNIGQFYSAFIYPYKGYYPSGATTNRFFPSLGNHDWYAPNNNHAKPYLDYFTLPGNERYYDFSWGPVHLFAIDSDLVIDDAEEDVTEGSMDNGSMSLNSSDLELVYDDSYDDPIQQLVGIRFNAIPIPKGATIRSAYIQFTAKDATSVEASLTIQGEASGNAKKFTSNSFDISSRDTTDASVPWNPSGWSAGSVQMTPDITPIIQEIVKREDWHKADRSRRNSLVIIISGFTGTRRAWSWDGNLAKRPLLHVEWTNGTVNRRGGTEPGLRGCIPDALCSDPAKTQCCSNSDEARWLEKKLKKSTAPWKIVYMHHPPFSSGEQGHDSSEWMQWPYKEWGADAVLAGHHHVYERLFCDDFPYFVNGLGGKKKDEFVGDPLPCSEYPPYYTDYGAMLVNASNNSIIFQFITRTGKIVDTYTLSK